MLGGGYPVFFPKEMEEEIRAEVSRYVAMMAFTVNLALSSDLDV